MALFNEVDQPDNTTMRGALQTPALRHGSYIPTSNLKQIYNIVATVVLKKKTRNRQGKASLK